MKKVFSYMLMAAVVCGLSLAVTSCKDDNNDGDGNVSKEEEQIQQSLKAESEFWSVAGKLAGTSAYTKDWENKTYEPIYGMPVQGNAHAIRGKDIQSFFLIQAPVDKDRDQEQIRDREHRNLFHQRRQHVAGRIPEVLEPKQI